ncbi:hypothetical protein [uncultured Ezakiella sp.]|nr:hypothetical protein [uncultured Ezakiella sp.]
MIIFIKISFDIVKIFKLKFINRSYFIENQYESLLVNLLIGKYKYK